MCSNQAHNLHDRRRDVPRAGSCRLALQQGLVTGLDSNDARHGADQAAHSLPFVATRPALVCREAALLVNVMPRSARVLVQRWHPCTGVTLDVAETPCLV